MKPTKLARGINFDCFFRHHRNYVEELASIRVKDSVVQQRRLQFQLKVMFLADSNRYAYFSLWNHSMILFNSTISGTGKEL